MHLSWATPTNHQKLIHPSKVIRVRPTDASYFNFKIQSFQVEVAPEDRKKQAHVPNIRIIDRGGGFSAKMHDLLSFETNVNAYRIKTGVHMNLKLY
jgi:hypothetical protein